jgi:hypothetical protein
VSLLFWRLLGRAAGMAGIHIHSTRQKYRRQREIQPRK